MARKLGWINFTSEDYLDINNIWKRFDSMKISNNDDIERKVTDEYILTNAAKMYIYLFTDLRNLWETSLDLFKSSFSKPLIETLLLTANYDPQDYFQETVKEILLQFLSDNLDLEFLNIDNLSFLDKVHKNRSITGT